MPPRLMRSYLREFCRITGSSGMMVLQIPERPHRRRRPVMDMHGMFRADVTAVIESSGCAVVKIEENTAAGGDWPSFLYFSRVPGR